MPTGPVGPQLAECSVLAFPRDHGEADENQQERYQRLQHKGRRQLAEAHQAGALPDGTECRAVLAVPLEIERRAGEGVNAGIKGCQGADGSVDIGSIVHHPVRVPVRLGLEQRICLDLVGRPGGALSAHMAGGADRRGRRKKQQGDEADDREPRAHQQPQFCARNQKGASHATAWPEKARCRTRRS